MAEGIEKKPGNRKGKKDKKPRTSSCGSRTNDLSPGEIAFVKGLSEGKTIRQAYSDACGGGLNDKVNGWQHLRQIQLKAPDIMNALGLSVEALIEGHLKPMLNATECRVFSDASRDEGVRYSREMPVWSARKDALDISFRLHGAYAKTSDGDGSTMAVTNNIQINNYIERPNRAAPQKELGANVN